MKPRSTIVIVLAIAAALVTVPSWAGGWFGIHIGSGGVGVSLGFSTWEPYTDAWYDPSWSLDFDVALAPYGEWVWVDGLGRVWQPYVAASWRPYTYGRWVWTAYGWTWVAYEPWGYIPHHFGRWALCGRGWVWVPGYTYTPAAVVWLSGGPLVGWYAAPPPGWHNAWWRGYDRGYRHGYRDGYRDGWRDARYATWVAWNDFTADNVARRAWTFSEVERRVPRGATRPLPSAPTRREVERRIGRPVPEAHLSERTVKVGSRTVRVARPEGVRRDIERNAQETVTRGLDRRVATRIEREVTVRERSRGFRPSRTVGVPSRTNGHGAAEISGRRVPATGSSGSSRASSSSRWSRVVSSPPVSSPRTVTRSAVNRSARTTTRTATRSRTSPGASASRWSSRTVTRYPSRNTAASSRTRTVTRSGASRSARVFRSASHTGPRRPSAGSSRGLGRHVPQSRATARTGSFSRSTARAPSATTRRAPRRSGTSHRPRR